MATQDTIIKDKKGVVISTTTTQISDSQVGAQVAARVGRQAYAANAAYLAAGPATPTALAAQVAALTQLMNYVIQSTFQAYDLGDDQQG